MIGGYCDRLKHYMVHGTQTLQSLLARLLLAFASLLGFDVSSTDVKLAYLQSTEPLRRRLFILNPAHEFELAPDQCFELLRPLQGLCDAGDLWQQTLKKHFTKDLGLDPILVETSLYFKFRLGVLSASTEPTSMT